MSAPEAELVRASAADAVSIGGTASELARAASKQGVLPTNFRTEGVQHGHDR